MGNKSWKNVFKSRAGVPVLILIVLTLFWSISYLTGRYGVWQIKNAYEKLSESNYKSDQGGNTPEETYDMFIATLKDGDVELASAYFVIEKHNDWFKILEEYKKNDLLAGFIKELEEIDRKSLNFKKGMFEKQKSGIWKIKEL